MEKRRSIATSSAGVRHPQRRGLEVDGEAHLLVERDRDAVVLLHVEAHARRAALAQPHGGRLEQRPSEPGTAGERVDDDLAQIAQAPLDPRDGEANHRAVALGDLHARQQRYDALRRRRGIAGGELQRQARVGADVGCGGVADGEAHRVLSERGIAITLWVRSESSPQRCL
jgi:hypothetical protein